MSQTTFVRPDNIVVFENKGHIGEVVESLLIITKPPLIHDDSRWVVAREAWTAGRNSIAGGARAAGQAGHSRAPLIDGQRSWTSKAETDN